ncbi:hypothetical protein GQ54DRAFT_311848 [Martensiomyces pterosporus]|nr:hypothetical protein GQ54DRAFT_311848 [Martensiomyces pterosporus]
MKPVLLVATVASALASLCHADIILSVAPVQDMSDYLAVLSDAWPRLYPNFDAQLAVARQQVPAEYNHLLQLLSITGVPSTFDASWASTFISNAEKVGPTTILADAIPGASTDPAVQPTQVITTNEGGNVATLTGAPGQHPTIVVAINGDAGRQAHAAQGSSSATATATGASGGAAGAAATTKKSGAASLTASSARAKVLAAIFVGAASAVALI